MFPKLFIALSVLMLAQLGSANIITPDQLAQSFVSAGLIAQTGAAPSGHGYVIMVTDLVPGTELSPAQAFAIATISTAILMTYEDDHLAESTVAVYCSDGLTRYLTFNQETAESITADVYGDEAATMTLSLVIGFNSLPTV